MYCINNWFAAAGFFFLSLSYFAFAFEMC